MTINSTIDDKIRGLLEDIAARAQNSKKQQRLHAQEEARKREAQQVVNEGMGVTSGPMDLRLGDTGTTMIGQGSRRSSHPADNEKVPMGKK